MTQSPNLWKAILRQKALFAVAEAWGMSIPRCFGDGGTCEAKDLQLAHIEYLPSSVKGSGQAVERQREAIANPKNFQLLCFAHHLALTIQQVRERGLPLDQTKLSHMEALANQAIINRINERRARKLEAAEDARRQTELTTEKRLRLWDHVKEVRKEKVAAKWGSE